MHPADEYALIKAHIRLLEDRANALRQDFLSGAAPLRSPVHQVLIRQQTRRTFQRDLLPQPILADPRYWLETRSPIVTVSLCDASGSRQPHQLSAPMPARRRPAHRDDDLVLVE
jgi:hypothetical protein